MADDVNEAGVSGDVRGAGADGAPARQPVLLAERGEAQEFTDAVMAFLAAARRTRGRLQPLFDDVSVPQLVLLDAVEACGSEGIGAVAEYTGLSQPTVTRGAAALEQAGLVRRELTGQDGRRRVLSLTDRGTALLQDKRQVLARHFTMAWDLLDPHQRAFAAPLLRRLAELVEHLL